MIEKGIVSKIFDNFCAEVEFEPNQACQKCRGCRMIEAGKMMLKAKNEINAKIGDLVIVEIPEDQTIKAAFLIFIFPIISLIAGYFIGGIMWSLIFLAAAFFLLHIYDRRLKSKGGCSARIVKLNS